MRDWQYAARYHDALSLQKGRERKRRDPKRADYGNAKRGPAGAYLACSSSWRPGVAGKRKRCSLQVPAAGNTTRRLEEEAVAHQTGGGKFLGCLKPYLQTKVHCRWMEVNSFFFLFFSFFFFFFFSFSFSTFAEFGVEMTKVIQSGQAG